MTILIASHTYGHTHYCIDWSSAHDNRRKQEAAAKQMHSAMACPAAKQIHVQQQHLCEGQ